MKTTTFFEIKHGNGTVGKNGNYGFQTAEEATEVARDHKENPRLFNENMSDANVRYWQEQTYTVVKKTIIEQTIITI